ncbi:MAG: hypothetical protein AAF665_08695 [Pseudomonadota bacterium]
MTQEPSAADARAKQCVEKIVRSGVLGNSERRASLLRYLVDKELAGNGRDIKAFTIAVDVLGRDASFDPNTDSIVRSEIGRLRDALRLYNAEYADPEDLRIDIPKGTYRPVIPPLEIRRAQSNSRMRLSSLLLAISVGLLAIAYLATQVLSPSTAPSTAERGIDDSGLPYEVIRIAVPIPKVYGTNPNSAKIAIGLNAELMMGLSAYPWLTIISPVTGFDGIEPGEVDYVLDGEVFWGDEILETHIKLLTYPEQKLVWNEAQSIKLDASAVRDVVARAASSIAFDLASARGIAPELAKSKNAHVSPENLDAYICYLGVHRYIAAPTREDHLQLRGCLSQAVAEFPKFGDAWAGLALVYIDEARFGTNAREGANPWEDARRAVQNALEFSPLRMPSLNVALITSIESPKPDEAEFDRVSRLLLNLFPKHPTTLYNVGSRAAEFLGRWDDGMALVEEAIDLSPDPFSAYFLTRAYKASMDGTDAEAMATVEPLVSTTATSQLLLNYLAAVRNDLPLMAKKYKALLQTTGLASNEDLVNHVIGRRYEPNLQAALLEQLDSARSRHEME